MQMTLFFKGIQSISLDNEKSQKIQYSQSINKISAHINIKNEINDPHNNNRIQTPI